VGREDLTGSRVRRTKPCPGKIAGPRSRTAAVESLWSIQTYTITLTANGCGHAVMHCFPAAAFARDSIRKIAQVRVGGCPIHAMCSRSNCGENRNGQPSREVPE
jgi:hypothetical protein